MNEITREDLVHFCGNLQYRLELLGQTRLHTDRLLATRFNVFGYIRPNENGLSDIIADLLRPSGRHGQGDAFLKEFLETMGGAVPLTWKLCEVRREHATSSIENSQRRLDVLIKLDGFGVAIENKPWAGEQYEQLHDYVTHLDRGFAGNFVMIYLSPGGAEPTSIGKDLMEKLMREKKLVLCAYCGRFHEWLTRCYRICAAEKIRWFLSDFIAFTEHTFPIKAQLINLPGDE